MFVVRPAMTVGDCAACEESPEAADSSLNRILCRATRSNRTTVVASPKYGGGGLIWLAFLPILEDGRSLNALSGPDSTVTSRIPLSDLHLNDPSEMGLPDALLSTETVELGLQTFPFRGYAQSIFANAAQIGFASCNEVDLTVGADGVARVAAAAPVGAKVVLGAGAFVVRHEDRWLDSECRQTIGSSDWYLTFGGAKELGGRFAIGLAGNYVSQRRELPKYIEVVKDFLGGASSESRRFATRKKTNRVFDADLSFCFAPTPAAAFGVSLLNALDSKTLLSGDSEENSRRATVGFTLRSGVFHAGLESMVGGRRSDLQAGCGYEFRNQLSAKFGVGTALRTCVVGAEYQGLALFFRGNEEGSGAFASGRVLF
jgi:hypothetical protein